MSQRKRIDWLLKQSRQLTSKTKTPHDHRTGYKRYRQCDILPSRQSGQDYPALREVILETMVTAIYGQQLFQLREAKGMIG